MEREQRRALWPILLGLAAAVLAPLAELATGSPLPYLLVLTLLMALTWGLARLRRDEMGWRLGRVGDHVLALLYPVGAMGLLALAAWAAGSLQPDLPAGAVLARRLGLTFLSTWVAGLITEEGFFRGALWGLALRSGWSRRSVLLWTAVAFMAWHVAVPLIEKDFLLPAHQIPIYYANVLLLGLAWGLLRMASGSLLVAATAHASWNALAYVLFGYGLETTSLGLQRITLFDPERGLLGLVVNAAVVVLFVLWARRRGVTLT